MSALALDAAQVSVTLPTGLRTRSEPSGPVVHKRRATLRPIIGRDEEALLRVGDQTPARRVTLLIGRCLVAPDGDSEVIERDSIGTGTWTARRLTVGDREALLLHLQRLTFGEALDVVFDCPRLECAAKMDLALSVSELVLSPSSEPLSVHEATVEGDDGLFTVRFRLPTGADQEDAADRLRTEGVAAAVELLTSRCLQAVIYPDGAAVEVEAGVETLPPAMLAGLSSAIADADPQAELLLNLTCPVCGQAFSSRFDAGAFLLAELAGSLGHPGMGNALYRQVHDLALHYHWSEPEILALTPGKRRFYLSLLADDVGTARIGSPTAGVMA